MNGTNEEIQCYREKLAYAKRFACQELKVAFLKGLPAVISTKNNQWVVMVADYTGRRMTVCCDFNNQDRDILKYLSESPAAHVGKDYVKGGSNRF